MKENTGSPLRVRSCVTAEALEQLKKKCDRAAVPRDGLAALAAPGCTIIADLSRGSLEFGSGCSRDCSDMLQHPGVGIVATNHCGYLAQRVIEQTCKPLWFRQLCWDPYSVYSARSCGADIVSVGMSRLGESEKRGEQRIISLVERAHSLGMLAIGEVNSIVDANRGLRAGLKVLAIGEDFGPIATGIPESVLRIFLRGARTPRHLLHAAAAGADAIVVEPAPKQALGQLAAAGQHPACSSRRG